MWGLCCPSMLCEVCSKGVLGKCGMPSTIETPSVRYVMSGMTWYRGVYIMLSHPINGFTQVLHGSSAALLNLDRTFRIELQFLQEDAPNLLYEKINEGILAAFPTETKAVTLIQTQAALVKLRESEMCKLSSRASQSAVDAMTKMIAKMSSGSAPPESVKTGGEVFSSAWNRPVYGMMCGME